MPGRSRSRKFRLAWLVPAAVLGAGAIWWLARGPRSTRHDDADSDSARAVARTLDPAGYVAARAGRDDPEAVKELVDAYGKWTDRADALEARKLAVKTMLAHPNIKVGVEAVLAAVDSDQTPRALDPMWPYLVQSVAATWDAMTFSFGRDLVQMETRAKPHDLLLSSLTSLAETTASAKLTDPQRYALATDLIDMYPTLKPEQKPEVDRALAALAGTDVVDILGGRGLGPASHLHAAVEAQQAMNQARGALRVPMPAQ